MLEAENPARTWDEISDIRRRHTFSALLPIHFSSLSFVPPFYWRLLNNSEDLSYKNIVYIIVFNRIFLCIVP